MNLENDYFNWLVSQIDIPSNNLYLGLFEKMHDTEFVWIITGDDNRLQDALDVRSEFMHGRRNHSLDNLPVSVLEVLIALSRRVAWITNHSPEYWAWELIKNLRLHKASDPLTKRKEDNVEDILESLIWRTYERDGQGGFFPLKYPTEDQTKKEIWDQMNAYNNEKNRAAI
jgi:hypothetical protein